MTRENEQLSDTSSFGAAMAAVRIASSSAPRRDRCARPALSCHRGQRERTVADLRRTRPRPAQCVPRPGRRDQRARRSAGPTGDRARNGCDSSAALSGQARRCGGASVVRGACVALPITWLPFRCRRGSGPPRPTRGVVGEVSPDTACEIDRERADLMRRDEADCARLRSACEPTPDAVGLAGRGLLGLGDDLLAVLTGGLANLCLGARLGELAGISQRGLDQLLRLVGLGDVPSIAMTLVEHGGQQNRHLHTTQDDDQADRRQKMSYEAGTSGLRRLLPRQ